MKIHVCTPISRMQHLRKLAHVLKSQGAASWILLIDQNQSDRIDNFGGWATIQRYASEAKTEPGCVLTNRYLSAWPFVDDDWYTMICDDDWIPEGFLTRLMSSASPETDLIICSMKRGQNTPKPGGHPTWDLVASPNSLNYGYIGFEQGTIRGRAIKDYRSKNQIGVVEPNEKVLISMAKQYNTVYVPDAFVLFNYLEPGRWQEPGATGMYD